MWDGTRTNSRGILMSLCNFLVVLSSLVVTRFDGCQTERGRVDDSSSRQALFPIGRRRLEIDLLEPPQYVVFGYLVVIDYRRVWKESGHG